MLNSGKLIHGINFHRQCLWGDHIFELELHVKPTEEVWNWLPLIQGNILKQILLHRYICIFTATKTTRPDNYHKSWQFRSRWN